MTASRKRKEMEELIASQMGREMGARTILFHQAIANLAGVSITDLKCLDYVHRGGDVTAGDLARMTGLTTGAITAALDRLEKAGLARRERSEVDRRKVYIRLCESPRGARIAPFYEALGQEASRMISHYSMRELETIKDFCERCIEMMRRQTEAVQKATQRDTEAEVR